MLKEVDDSLNDAVILQGVLETEHHEIAVYDGLIIMAEQMGDDDVIALLNENVEQEAATLEKAIKATQSNSRSASSSRRLRRDPHHGDGAFGLRRYFFDGRMSPVKRAWPPASLSVQVPLPFSCVVGERVTHVPEVGDVAEVRAEPVPRAAALPFPVCARAGEILDPDEAAQGRAIRGERPAERRYGRALERPADACR